MVSDGSLDGRGETNVVVDGAVVCQGWVFEACLGFAEEEAWAAPCHHACEVSIYRLQCRRTYRYR